MILNTKQISAAEIVMVGRISVFVYGIVAYMLFLGSFLYAIGFVGNWVVPKSIDSGDEGSLRTSLAVNIALMPFAVEEFRASSHKCRHC